MATWYVDSSATGLQDGSSPANAWKTMEWPFQATINHGTVVGDNDGAGAPGQGDIIIVRRTHSDVFNGAPLTTLKPRAAFALSGGGTAHAVKFIADGHPLVGQEAAWSGDSASAVPKFDGTNNTSINNYFNHNVPNAIIAWFGIRWENFDGGNAYVYRHTAANSGSKFKDCEFEKWNSYCFYGHREQTFLEVTDSTFDGTAASNPTYTFGMLGTTLLRRLTLANAARGITWIGGDASLSLLEDIEMASSVGKGITEEAPKGVFSRNLNMKMANRWDQTLKLARIYDRIFLMDHDYGETGIAGVSSAKQLAISEIRGSFQGTRVTSPVDTGADWSWRAATDTREYSDEPSDTVASIDEYFPAVIFESSRWVDTANITVQLRARPSNWTTVPTAAQFFLRVGYYNGTDADRTFVLSAQAFTANDTWTSFNVNFTPSAVGPITIEAILAVEEIGNELIFVSPVIEIT